MSDEPLDPSRRRFFRSFSRDAVQAAAQLVGAAGAVQRGASAAAAELLGLHPEAGEPPVTGGGTPFRSPYRLEGERLVVLDQARFPAATVELHPASAQDVAALIRARQARGAPLLGQLAAYGVWLAALAGRDRAPAAREELLRRAVQALRFAAPNVTAVGIAAEQVLAAAGAGDEAYDGQMVADRARVAADGLAMRLALDLSHLVRLGAAALPTPAGRPLEILTLDSTGALSSGQAGTALGMVQVAAAEGRSVHVWLLETRPYRSGARLAAWELGLAGVPASVVPDAAAAWLLARTAIDTVLLGADRIAADGALTAVIGTYGLAELALRHGVPVWVAAPLLALDGAVAGASDSPVDAEAYAGLGEPDLLVPGSGDSVSARGPLQDVTPPELLSAIVTEAGLIRPPFAAGLTAALAAGRPVAASLGSGREGPP